jgi:hypothetical protein
LLVLSKIAKNFVLFYLFYSSFHVHDYGVSEQFLRIFPTLTLVNIAQIHKNTILLTLALVNIFAKNEFEEEIFYVIFFLVYPLLLLAFFVFFICFRLDRVQPYWLGWLQQAGLVIGSG